MQVADHLFVRMLEGVPDAMVCLDGDGRIVLVNAQASGDVEIDSEPGIGTTVTVLLPSTEQEVRAGSEPEQEAGHGTGETVLVVEDEPAMREVTRRILSGSGYHVLTAADGREAIEIVASAGGDIDVLLTDIVMPQMLGQETADRIRAFRPGVKVLFMSGYPQGLLGTQEEVEADVNLIEKPFAPVSLLAKLREILASDGPDPGGPPGA